MKSSLLFLSTFVLSALAMRQLSDDECIWSCMNQALKYTECTDATNLSCICHSDSFKAETTDCIKSICSASALDEALATRESECQGK